jgi:hypothetical protein
MTSARRFEQSSICKLPLVLTVVLQVFITAQSVSAASTVSTGAAAGTPSPTPTPDTAPEVLVSENRSVLQYPSGYADWNPFNTKDSICTWFQVSPHGDAVQHVVITSSGLGEVTFRVDEAGGGGGRCPTTTEGEQSQVLLPLLDRTRKILMRVPGNEVPELGDTIEGKILVATPKQKPQEIPIKVANPTSAFRTAWLWVWGIVIPGAITFLFGYLAVVANNWYTGRKTESDAFRKYKDENHGALEGFFTGPYAISDEKSEDDRTFAEAVRGDLMKEKILAALPKPKRRKLEKMLGRCDRQRIKAVLIALFPEWQDAISAAKKDEN